MRKERGLAACAALATLLPAVSMSQANQPARSPAVEPQLEEVIVSATKRGDVDLQSTPLTITAFTSDALQNQGLNDLGDLSSLTPGLDIQQVSPGQSQVIMRGVTLGGVASAALQNRATTGMYVNDVSFEQNGMNPDPDLFDLERVEVLKGPQGTLFGSSAMAGAIRYVTKRPDLNTFSGRVVADASTTRHGGDSNTGKGVVNIPLLDDTLAMRVMAYRNDNAGWIDNPVTGHTDINTDKETGARVSMLWQMSDALSAHLMTQYQKMEVGHYPTAQLGDSQYWGPGPRSVDEFKTYMKGESAWNDKFLLSTLEVNWQLEGATLTSVTGYVDRKFENFRPGDMQEFMLDSFGVDLPNPVFTDPYKSNKFSQELRVAAKLGTIADVTAGVYFSDGDISYSSLMREDGWDQYMNDFFFTDPATQGCLPEQVDAVFCGTQTNKERQVSVYGEADFHVTSKLTLTAGARWFTYDQKYEQNYGGFFNGGPTQKTQKFHETGINPKFSVSYDATDDLMMYASAAKGFRLGGVDDPIPLTQCGPALIALGLSDYDGVFDADTLWTYELGAKSALFNNRVTVNGAVFDTEWSDIQTTTFLGVCGYSVTQNASKQRIRGAELATRFALSNNLSLEINGNYTDARLDGKAIVGDDGDPAPYTPRYTFSGTLDYEQPFTNTLAGFALLSVSNRADYHTEYRRLPDNLISSQTVANLRLGVKSDRYKATLFVRNLTDELIVASISEGRGGEQDMNVGRPRTIGIELQADF